MHGCQQELGMTLAAAHGDVIDLSSPPRLCPTKKMAGLVEESEQPPPSVPVSKAMPEQPVPSEPVGNVQEEPVPSEPVGNVQEQPVPSEPVGNVPEQPVPSEPVGNVPEQPLPSKPVGNVQDPRSVDIDVAQLMNAKALPFLKEIDFVICDLLSQWGIVFVAPVSL